VLENTHFQRYRKFLDHLKVLFHNFLTARFKQFRELS